LPVHRRPNIRRPDEDTLGANRYAGTAGGRSWRAATRPGTASGKRKAGHIEDSYRARGVDQVEAEARAWATVNKQSGGGEKSGGGRSVSSRRKSAARSNSARRAVATRRGRSPNRGRASAKARRR
jgi:hypothetical protein